jgi:hypothetical protein
MPDPEQDAMEELRERVRATQEAAERIMDSRPPRRGWAAPPPAAGETTSEMQALVGLLESVRDLLPPDLRAQVTELVRQLLLVLRALIDWLVDQLDRRPRGDEPEVEDIPIS